MNPFQHSGRRMKRNHSGAIPRYIFAIDCETTRHPMDKRGKKFAHSLRLAVGIFGRYVDGAVTAKRWYRFSTEQEIWDTIHKLTRTGQTLWVVAHNALFDMVISGMPEQFETAQLIPDMPRTKRSNCGSTGTEQPLHAMLSIESPPTIIAARSTRTQGRIVIVDSMNWFPCKLADLGSALGMEKFSMPPFEATDDEWFYYCQRDTAILFDTFINLIEWVKKNDMGMFRYTGPSQSMAAFRHRFSPCQIYLHDNLPIKAIERSGYFGGRFEVFRLGSINHMVYQFDANSLFPSVMRFNKFPVCLDSFELPTRWTANLPGLDWKASLAEVEIETKEPIYPKRDRRGTLFPIGRFRTTLCGAELYRAYRTGIIRRIRAHATYRMAQIFEGFVDELWAMRQRYKAEGNILYDMFTKTLLNSLYGKFAQRSPQWQTIEAPMSALPWTQWVTYDTSTGDRLEYRSFGWTVQKRDNREIRHDAEMSVSDWNQHAIDVAIGELPTTFVAVSAFVTAAARVRMNHLREVAGNRNVYYQGVDSLIVNNEGQLRLQAGDMICEKTLGKLRLQMTTDDGEILGCSDYRLGDKVVIAGCSHKPNMTEQQTGMQMHMSAKSNLFHGISTNIVDEKLTPWRRTSQYWKGKIQDNGWVDPLVLGGVPNSTESDSLAAVTANSDRAVTTES